MYVIIIDNKGKKIYCGEGILTRITHQNYSWDKDNPGTLKAMPKRKDWSVELLGNGPLDTIVDAMFEQ